MKNKISNNKSNDKTFIILLIVLIFISIIIIFARLTNGKNLKTDNELVVELHDYFSSENLENCEGLFNYAEEKIKYDDVSIETKKCLAYQKSDIESSILTTISSDKNKKTCSQDDMIFKTDDDSNECTITKIEKNIIENTYKKLFGKEIEDDKAFKVDNFHICYLKDKYYYCGLSETFTYTIGSESIIYRVIQKATEKGSTIEIYDYFVKINEDKCFKSYTTVTENSECTSEYKNNKKINYKFMERYTTRYKHTFKKAKDNTYYWISSEPLN